MGQRIFSTVHQFSEMAHDLHLWLPNPDIVSDSTLSDFFTGVHVRTGTWIPSSPAYAFTQVLQRAAVYSGATLTET